GLPAALAGSQDIYLMRTLATFPRLKAMVLRQSKGCIGIVLLYQQHSPSQAHRVTIQHFLWRARVQTFPLRFVAEFGINLVQVVIEPILLWRQLDCLGVRRGCGLPICSHMPGPEAKISLQNGIVESRCPRPFPGFSGVLVTPSRKEKIAEQKMCMGVFRIM